MTDTRERGKVDFQDLAKLAALPKDGASEEKKENSGIIHLSALAAGEAIQPETAEVTRKSLPLPTPPSSREVIRKPPPQGSPSPVRPPWIAAVAPAPTRSTLWMALATGIALGALTAGLLFGFHETSSAKTSSAASTSPEHLMPANPPPTARAATTGASDSSGHEVDLSALATAAEPTRPSTSAVAPSPAVAAIASPNASAKPSATTRATTVPGSSAPMRSEAAPPRSGADDGLEALMKRAVGPSDRSAPPGGALSEIGTAGTTSTGNAGLPAKPAMGAVQGALGTVMPAARYCLGPDDPVSRATITFKSDGSVQTVSVTGDAAGQPAEGCIRSRLMAARVPPFAGPTFTWTVTVRPAN